jgi:hypothetical protein
MQAPPFKLEIKLNETAKPQELIHKDVGRCAKPKQKYTAKRLPQVAM